MYFWVILGSLMVSMIALRQPVRDDYVEKTSVKQAESYASWVITYHSAAMKYISNNPNYSAGEIPIADINIYAPPESKLDAVGVKAEIFCFDKSTDGANNPEACEYDGSTGNFLITHFPVPVHWKIRESGNVRPELKRAIAKITNFSILVGPTITTSASDLQEYNGVYYGVKGSTMGIESYSRGVRMYVPPGAQSSIGYGSIAYISVLEGGDGGLPL